MVNNYILHPYYVCLTLADPLLIYTLAVAPEMVVSIIIWGIAPGISIVVFCNTAIVGITLVTEGEGADWWVDCSATCCWYPTITVWCGCHRNRCWARLPTNNLWKLTITLMNIALWHTPNMLRFLLIQQLMTSDIIGSCSIHMCLLALCIAWKATLSHWPSNR